MDEAGGASAGGAAPLPCLSTNNCDKGGSVCSPKVLHPAHKKVAHALAQNVKGMADKFGVERIGFLTLTFRDHVLDAKEAGRRFHNLSRRVLQRYSEWIAVIERQESGRIHFHLLVVVAQDIKTGFDFEAVKRKSYANASRFLRDEWAFWRKTGPKYGFGRTELLPVKSNAEAIARYVGKYISKHIGQRLPEDKGVRLVRYSKGAAQWGCRFAWLTPGADLWRWKFGALASALGFNQDNATTKFKEWFGDNWIFVLRPIVESIRFEEYPTAKHAARDFPEAVPVELMQSTRVRPGAQDLSERRTVGSAVHVTLREVWRARAYRQEKAQFDPECTFEELGKARVVGDGFELAAEKLTDGNYQENLKMWLTIKTAFY